MPIERRMDKKMWYIYIMKYYSDIKKNEIVPFAATWRDLETVIQGEVRQREILHDVFYIQNLKISDANELIYKTETVSQT